MSMAKKAETKTKRGVVIKRMACTGYINKTEQILRLKCTECKELHVFQLSKFGPRRIHGNCAHMTTRTTR
jgi:hypothetical protein